MAAAPLYLAAVVLPALAVDAPTLLLAALVVGAANGTLDIAMNAQGIAVERAAGRPLFDSLHAAFSFGALAGAGLGAAAAALDVARPSPRLAALGTLAFCALLAEGAVFDWSGVYLDSEAGSPAGLAPLGLAAFALCMGVCRLAADGVLERLGSARTARVGPLVAALGLGLALAVAAAAVAIAGFLAGPPLIGLLAGATSLRAALVPVAALCVLAAALTTAVGRRP